MIDVQKLIDRIKLARCGDKNTMMGIIEQFSPLIEKYTRKLNYDEDCRSELILKLIVRVKNEINICKLRSESDGVVVNYIYSALYHHYIGLSKERCRARDNEAVCDYEMFEDFSEDKAKNDLQINDIMLMETLKYELTEKEFVCISLITIHGWTAEAVARKYGVSKQAVNQCKNRVLDKIRKIYNI